MLLVKNTENIIIPIMMFLDELILSEDDDFFNLTFYHPNEITENKINIFKDFFGYKENTLIPAFYVRLFEREINDVIIRFIKTIPYSTYKIREYTYNDQKIFIKFT